MTTKPPADINLADENSLIKKIYNIVDELKEFIPVDNDRNRLSFTLNLFFSKEVDSVENAIIQAQPRSSTIMYTALAEKISERFRKEGLLKH